ncbi:MAG: urea carboxylase [Acidobacteriota bacterium]
MFSRVLIANRGEIALRAMRTLRRMNVRCIAVVADSDRDALHARMADQTIALGGARPANSYMHIEKIVDACLHSGAEAVFPGYGFLAENPDFAEACESAGIAFIGPAPGHIRAFSRKHRARELAAAAGIPLTPGSPLLADIEAALDWACRLGYPVVLKSTVGGGGLGLARCSNPEELRAAFERIPRLGEQIFGDRGVFLEGHIDGARHIEVQIFGDGQGRVAALGERDCSIQRRHQKIVEQTPAPHLSETLRAELLDAAVRLGQSIRYRSAATIEFLCEPSGGAFHFLEANARLQVEHPITEMVTGLDLVECMVRLAAGEAVDWHRIEQRPHGAAMEARIYAEDPDRGFRASPGTITAVHFPQDVRIDHWIEPGTEISTDFDPLLAKVIVHAASREQARIQLSAALRATRIDGMTTNLDYLRQIVASPEFIHGETSTRFLDTFTFLPRTIEVVEAGTWTTVQDYPGRLGYWDVGVPPSGPMDDVAFRLANRIVGNPPEAAALECTLDGPTLRFACEAVIALTGAECSPTLDGAPVSMWTPIHVRPGQVLAIGPALTGFRTYLAVRNGLDVPVVLGSRSTFVLGSFGGHAGRILRAGDILQIADSNLPACGTQPPLTDPLALPPAIVPEYSGHWQIAVLHGPHGAPDYCTHESIAALLAAEWEVHHNSNRLGVRLTGPRPHWTRSSGGEAGLHPSNVHDCVYAVGSVNFTGDSPVILGRDGPSLGGFVCPLTVAQAEWWKVGQLRPGDKVRFVPVSDEDASALEAAQEQWIQNLTPPAMPLPSTLSVSSPAVLARREAQHHHPRAHWRQAGDHCILLEYGDDVLDLALRLRVHLLMQAIRDAQLPIEELSPGVRSLQIRYDSRRIRQPDLLRHLLAIDEILPDVENLRIPTRILHLPLAFDDSATLAAVQRYRETVRASAPWLPSNIEFLRRINGLRSIDNVRDIIGAARYMVLGLGDVYLGAPCAVALDPRHRLLSSKYNPARTFTAEGTVGIGGMYLCIYGIDSPGGYQLVGRTLPIWNRFLHNRQFASDKPWLLRFFDQIAFYPVEEKELQHLRDAFRRGQHTVLIEHETFDFAAYRQFLEENRSGIAAFREQQHTAFMTEVAHWKEQEISPAIAPAPTPPMDPAQSLGGHRVVAPVHGSVWKLLANPGERVQANQPLLLVEAMKMEMSVHAPVPGTIKAICCLPGQRIATGDILAVIEPYFP